MRVIIKRTMTIRLIAVSILTIALSGCMTAAQHQQTLHPAQEREMTVGIVQKEIHVGMSGAEVAQTLGSPNIVTTDEQGREVWIYDKIATEASYSTSSGGVGAVGAAAGVPGTTLLLGILTGSYSQSAGASATTQKTLTVIIKFDKEKKVRDFAYHSSRF
jgi:outer membrane protein assembly factor BamE (lipoprotein component of BamABCDE complex)